MRHPCRGAVHAITVPLLLGNCGRFMWGFARFSVVLRGCHSIVGAERNGYGLRDQRKPAMFRRLVLLLALLGAGPALAQERAMTDRAFDAAIATFEAAWPRLDATEMG